MNLPPTPAAEDELTRIELMIARRADELMRQRSGSMPPADVWREAEAEVWEAHSVAVEARPSRRRGSDIG